MSFVMPIPAAPQPVGRLRLTGYAVAQVFWAVPLLALFVISLVGGVLMLVWGGALILAVSIPSTRFIAQLHRRMAARVLGVPEPQPYRPVPWKRPWTALGVVLRDPMTYRDLGWLIWAFTFGFVLALICVLELLAVVTLPLWWFTLRIKMRARSQIDLWFLTSGRTGELQERVHSLTETRNELVDHSAAELRRLERDLHDGAQARLVALSMSLGLADQALDSDPQRARDLVNDARATTTAAIRDLRSVVKGIHPPVLADRGLGGAVEALALDMAVPIEVTTSLPGRPPAPIESALYFAIAECLANIGKHAEALSGSVCVEDTGTSVRAIVRDNGSGGADPAAGTGMLGVQRRLAAFDGTMTVVSPVGGPTRVTLEVPCDSSSPRITPSCAPE